MNDLTVAEAAYPRGDAEDARRAASGAHHDRAVERRNNVIDRLLENGWIKQADAETAQQEPAAVVANRSNGVRTSSPASISPRMSAATSSSGYGEKKLYEGGLSVRTTLDPKMQLIARKTDGWRASCNYDEAQGWRGASSKLDITGDWGLKLAEVPPLSDIAPWRLAVVLETQRSVGADRASSRGVNSGGVPQAERLTGNITLDGVRWAKAAARLAAGQDADRGVAGAVSPGDVIYADPLIGKDGSEIEASIGCGSCRKSPAPWWRWIRGPAACSPWSAASRST